MSITWQRALSDDGSLKNISEVTDAYRTAHRFTCFGCDNELIAVLSKLREPHFRHAPGSICNPETYLHQAGKKMFVDLFELAKKTNKRLLIDW